MMTGHRRVAWFLVLMLAVPGLASAARLGRLIGKVVDPQGSPIPGVTVTTTSAAIPALKDVTTTNARGIFMVDFETINVLYLHELAKAGYVTLRVEQNWSVEGTERHEFTMQPGETRAPGGPPPASTSSAAIQAFNDGVRAFEVKDYPVARAKFEEALAHDASLRQAWAALSRIHFAQERYQETAAATEKAIALGSADESILKLRWEAYRKLGDDTRAAEARKALESLGRLAEEAKRIHNEGVALSKAGDLEGAFGKFQEALKIDPDLQPALLGVAVTGLKIGREAEAAAAAETILRADPQNKEAPRIRYNASLKLGDEAKVIDALVGLASVDPVTARDGLFRLGTAAYDSDQTVEAKKRLRKVLELDPDHPRSHYYLGLILMREGARREAVSHFERFLRLAPDDADAATAREILRQLREP